MSKQVYEFTFEELGNLMLDKLGIYGEVDYEMSFKRKGVCVFKVENK